MKRLSLFFSFIFIFVLCSSVIFALDVSVDASSSPVVISGSCTAQETVMVQVSSNGILAYIGETTADSNGDYSLEFTSTSEGTHSISVSCDGDYLTDSFDIGSTTSSSSTSDTGFWVQVDSSSSSVAITGFCSEGDVATMQISYGGLLAFIGEGDVDSNDEFSVDFTSTGDGTHSIYISCAGETLSGDFCVGSSCSSTLVTFGSVDSGDVTETTGTTDDGGDSGGSSSGGSSGGGRGSSYYSDDSSSGSTDTTDDGTCTESWFCGEWTECNGGQQTRSCADEHSCGTYLDRPEETRDCTEEGSSSSSSSSGSSQGSSGTTNPPSRETQYVQETSFMDPVYFFFAENWLLVLIGVFVLLVLIGGIVFFLKYREHHAPAANMDELHGYIASEREAGMTDQQIETSLVESGWAKSEVDQGLGIN